MGGELQLHLAIIFVKSKGGGRFGKNSEGLGGREISVWGSLVLRNIRNKKEMREG